MFLSNLLRRVRPRAVHNRAGSRPGHRRRVRARPAFEALEDRTLLAYTFTLLEQTGPAFTALPEGQAINDVGQVAFEASLPNGNQAIYRRELDGSLTTIATVAAPNTIWLPPYMNDAGQVSFGVKMPNGTQEILRGDGQDLTDIADTGPGTPFRSLPNPAPQIGDDGTVYFRATLKSGGAGLFTGDGANLVTLYQTGGQFSAFLNSPNIERHGEEFAFRAILSGGPECVCSADGGPVDIIASAGGTYSTFLSNTNNDDGDVVFTAKLTAGGEAVVTPDGNLADTSGAYSQFFAGQLTLNNDGTVVFGADLKAGGHGIFQGPDAVADKILVTGDPLFGSSVAAFPDNFLNNRGLNDAGQIVFRATLADGRTVLAVAQPNDDQGGDEGGGNPGSDSAAALRAFAGMPGISPDGMNAELAQAFIASLQPLAAPTTLPESASSVSSGPPALTSVGVAAPGGRQEISITSDPLARASARDLLFAQLDSDLSVGW